jgi:hypothetical protein
MLQRMLLPETEQQQIILLYSDIWGNYNFPPPLGDPREKTILFKGLETIILITPLQ